MGKVFKVRFRAAGLNSLDILKWMVDNVHIYRTCDEPTDLEAAAQIEDEILLTWTAPQGTNIDEWIQWDDGVFSGNSIGTGAAVEFDAAQRWEPAQLVDYEGAAVTEIAFVPAEVDASYSIRVWQGAGAANMVVDQLVPTPIIGDWNYVTLDTPYPIDVTQELWIGYYVNANTGHPGGTDAGPAVDGYGNMMNFGGWQTLLQINPDLDYNWNIAGHLVSLSGDNISLPGLPQDDYATEGAVGQSFNLLPPANFAAPTGTRAVTGYNIYMSFENGLYELLDFTTETEYMHEGVVAGIYCYKVTAVWESATDYCESPYSNEDCEVATDINDPEAGAQFSMYPNPAVDHVMINSSDELQRVTVMNTLGQLVIDEVISGNQYELQTSAYTVGTYMVKIETDKGVKTEILTIQR